MISIDEKIKCKSSSEKANAMLNNYTYFEFCELFAKNCNKFRFKNAVIDLKDNRCYTFDQIFCTAQEVQKMLGRLGVKAHSRVAVISQHSPYSVICNICLAYAGLTAVLLDANLPVDELNNLIEFSAVSAFFVSPEMYSKIEKRLLVDVPVLIIQSDLQYELVEKSYNGIKPSQEEIEEDVIAIIYSSGTTETMKGIKITYLSIVRACEYMIHYTNLCSTATFLNVLPSNHIAGYSSSISAFLSGAEMGFAADLSPLGLAQAFQLYNPTNFIMVPQVYEIIMRKIYSAINSKPLFIKLYAEIILCFSRNIRKITGIKLRVLTKPIWKAALGSKMKICGCGTAPCHPEIMAFYLNLGIDFVNVYGSTETGFPITATNCNDKYTCNGAGNVFQFSEIQVKIFNPDEAGIGEIRVKSVLMMKGYFRDAKKTNDAFDENGFFMTGDSGYIDNAGNLFITGRIKEAILLKNGKKVSPSVVDEIYQNICGDVFVASVGVPCENNSYDEIHLFIQKKGIDNDRILYAIEKIKERSPKIDLMYRINALHIIEEIPVTSVGKIKRYMLKQKVSIHDIVSLERDEPSPFFHSPREQIYEIINKLKSNDVKVIDSALLKDDLGFDSLGLFELSTEIETVLKVSVTAEMMNVHTVGELISAFEGTEIVSNIDLNNTHKNISWKILYKFLHYISRPIIKIKYYPVYLNQNNIAKDECVIYAPNHRQTLDSLIMIAGLSSPIHWVALKRFFEGKDSIFNNSKNTILCGLTKFLFNNLEMIPVDRNSDNIGSLGMLNKYLSLKESIGIYPEGTTNKNPDKEEVSEMKMGTFSLAMSNKVVIQPIAILWNHDSRHKVIINFCKPIDSKKFQDPLQLSEEWKKEIIIGLNESKQYSEKCKRLNKN